MDAIEAIITRRSTRKFKDKKLPKEILDKVIEAGRYAPSGHNTQNTHFVVIRDKRVLSELAAVVKNEFSGMEEKEDMYVSLKNAIKAARKEKYVFHYDPDALVVVANKKDYGNNMADSVCAVQNMMIAANALDIGSCYINQLHWLDGSEAVRNYLENIGLKSDETVCCSLSLGYADTENSLPAREPLPRVGNEVDYV